MSSLLKPRRRRPRRRPYSVLDLGALEILEDRTLLSPLTIAQENQRTGTSPSQWDIVNGAGDPTLQGFSTDISVDVGQTVFFKINDTALAPYHVDIYRMGYYQGNGARLVTTVSSSQTTRTVQPAPLSDPNTGEVDAGNWSVSASWAVPVDATSGIYFANLVREDTGNASRIVFVVRNDASHSQILFQTSDSTWQAYNTWGTGSTWGKNAYGGNSLDQGSFAGTSSSQTPGRAYAVSYNRPLTIDGGSGGFGDYNSVFHAEYPMVRWLESNGYDVSYFTDVDASRYASLILNHQIYMDVGHDEYISGQQRSNIQGALAAGVNLAFFSGNEVYWKTYWASSLDSSATSYRTLVCYKDSTDSQLLDPNNPTDWTGTWRDTRFSPPADGGQPENALTGNLYMDDRTNVDLGIPLQVPYADSGSWFWKNTAVANLQPGGQPATLGQYIVGYEVNEDLDNGFRPAGLIDLSSTTFSTASRVVVPWGTVVGQGTGTHSLTLYRAASGALVFGAGTAQWSWGLDGNHNDTTTTPDPSIQQATVNLLANMGAQPATLQAGLKPATASTDHTAPTSTITSPAPGASFPDGTAVTITGTATDAGGGVVAGVEVSVDGGQTWHPATGGANWSYTWVPNGLGSVTIKSRAVDDSGNLEVPSAGVSVSMSGPFSLWSSATIPSTLNDSDSTPQEVGVRFTSDVAANILGLRFYKGPTNTGTHVGSLWTAGGTLLNQATFTNETASGWQQVNFTSPVAISPNTVYVASYYTSVGHYASDDYYFLNHGVTNGPLHAPADGVNGLQGVFAPGSSSTFPTQSYHSANYWVDVVYSPISSDTTPPSAPGNLTATGSLGTAQLTWTASTDNVGVTGYNVYRSTTSGFTPSSSNLIGSATSTSYTDSGLAAGTYYYLVTAHDAAGNTSAQSNQASAAVTADTTPPTVALTAPTNNATVSGTVSVSATATDNVAVASVQFTLDGNNLGSPVTTAPYSLSWDTTTATNGSHTLGAIARDTSGNQASATAVAVTVSNAGFAGQVAAYSFDEGSGTTANDSSGNGNTGTIANATWVPGKYNSALKFTGATNSMVTISDSASVNLTTGMTLEAWVNPSSLSNSLGGNWDAAISKDHQNSSNDISYALYAATGTGTAPAVHILVGSTDYGAQGTSVLSLNTWTFLAATYDGTTLKMYVNGTLVGSQTVAGSIFTTTDPLHIGGDWDSEMFTGSIDNARIYKAALTPSQITTDMNTGVGPVQPPSAPGNLTATGSVGKVSLSWSASVGNPAIAGYTIYRSTTSGFTPSTSNQIGQTTATSFTDSGLAAGTYYYLVTAQDTSGNTSVPSNQASAAVSADTTPPTVALTAPTNNATVSGTVSVSATATDNVAVASVQFTLDGNNLGSPVTAAPYSFSWNTTTAANGSHTLGAIARDTSGNQASATAVTVTVSNDTTPPTVALTAPTNNATVSGTVSVSATATDNVAVAGVQFTLDGSNLGSEVTAAPYSFSWNTTTAANGSHTLDAIAYDTSGNHTT